MVTSVDTALDWLANLLPPRCTLCNGAGRERGFDLCAECESDLPAIANACLRCGLPVCSPVPEPGCDGCRQERLPYARCVAACDYAYPADALVHALKYGGQLSVGRVLGELLARRVAALGLELDVDCLLPVPLHPHRQAERGFNQCAEIARQAARRLRRPLAPGLARRVTDTPPQVGLSLADRRANVRGAFAVNSAGVAGRRLVIVDDVVTTGSTVAALARCLIDAGAASVDVWCVCRSI